jgi:hypothetical protein
MKKKKTGKKKVSRNRRATQVWSKERQQWENTGVISRPTALAIYEPTPQAIEKAVQVIRAAPPAQAAAAVEAVTEGKKSGKKRGKKKGSKKKGSKNVATPSKKRSSKKSGKKKSGKKKSGKKRSAAKRPAAAGVSARELRSLVSAVEKLCGGQGGKKRSKKRRSKKSGRKGVDAAPPAPRAARSGTKSKACKPFAGKRTKPVKCRQQPSSAALDACGLAAVRYGKEPKEACGPGTPRPTGRTLAKHRWGTLEPKAKKRGKKGPSFGVHSAAWGD